MEGLDFIGDNNYYHLTGKRTYTLTRHDETSVEFLMHETFSGLLAPLITRSIPDLQPSFNEFADCLKKHAETFNRVSDEKG